MSMTLFYDPHKKRPKIWVTIVFLIIPIIFVSILFMASKQFIDTKKPSSAEEETVDVFAE